MKKAEKAQAEEIVRLLQKVQEGILKKLEAEQKEEALELLSQCQEAAIQLGESIEGSEGEGFPTIALLEEYCETVYQIYESVRLGHEIHGGRTKKSLKKCQ